MSPTSARPLIVISDERHGSIEEERSVFEPLGVELRVADCRSSSDVSAACADADGILLNLAPMDAPAIASLRRCRVISRYGVGMDNVDLEAAAAKGIAVANVPGYCDEEVAEHALSLMLSLARGIPARDQGIRKGQWNMGSPQYALVGSTIGVAGFGGSGRAFARMALGLKPKRVAVWSPHTDQARLDRELGEVAQAMGSLVEAVDFEELLAESDFLSLHLKLTPDTSGLFSTSVFGRMKPRAFLVNTSRGGLVDSAALAVALDAGNLAGAALDVLDREPPEPGHPLIGRQDVILTDHCAYRSARSISELKTRCALNAARVLGLAP